MDRLPQDIARQFQEAHIERTWKVLEERFSFNVNGWKAEFRRYLQSQSRGISERQAFTEFGKKKIEPLLNLILKREQYHPTWTNLMRWILTNK